MKKTIFWDLKSNPLNVDNLNQFEIALAKEDNQTRLCVENITCNDLRLLINALNFYQQINKQLREIHESKDSTIKDIKDLQTAVGKLYGGQKVSFDKMDKIEALIRDFQATMNIVMDNINKMTEPVKSGIDE